MKKKAVPKMRVVKSETNHEKMIYSLKVTLDESQPEVWRKILVPGKFNLEKLHFVIQIVMGWENSHLHEFEIKGKRYINPDDDPDGMEGFPPSFSEKKVKIAEVLNPSDSFKYLYDFGDGWAHTIFVEELNSPNDIFNYPLCVSGANACPPEDCGGIYGYENLLKNLKDKKLEEHNSSMRWIGGQFDPHSFDANRVNRDGLWLQKW